MGRVILKAEKPTSRDTGALRSHLAKLGVDPDVAREIVKMSKTRAEIAADLVAYLKGRGRASV